ncbi:uncharacterized protein KY384_001524 [Bacidia gigantensis]|uniref:uncharacterized protein n=1 Tax=Bacidia gigantensis TaxID=2732470 RepID=UPI001D051220|nr:uncharacterized protein KY384_001524 [Bacidia gigantensis]KAG8533783.1 hypothetical protein KY384_001524 [Bacidia gigantensis]
MAKRIADQQLTQLNVHELHNPGANDADQWTNQRANASMMARRNMAYNRFARSSFEAFRRQQEEERDFAERPATNKYLRVIQPRGRRPAQRPGATSASLSQPQQQQSFQPQQAQQQSLPGFQQPSQPSLNFAQPQQDNNGQPQQNIFGGSQQNSFVFGQQMPKNVQTQASQSFPPFQGFGTQSNSTTNDQFTPPSSSFSFNTAPVFNPFAQASAITQEPPQPTPSTFSWPSTSRPQSQGSSIFSLPPSAEQPSTTQQQESQSPIAQALNQVKQVDYNNLFANMDKSKTNPFADMRHPQPALSVENDLDNSRSMFIGIQREREAQARGTITSTRKADLTTSQPLIEKAESQTDQDVPKSTNNLFTSKAVAKPPTPAKENPFAASIAQFRASQQNTSDSSSPFSESTQPAAKPDEVGAANPHSQPNLFSSDTIPASSNIATQEAPQPQSTPFQIFGSSTSQSSAKPSAATGSPQAGNSLFDRVSFPSGSTNERPKVSFSPPEGQPTGGSLFANVSKLSPPTLESPPRSHVDLAQTAGSSLFQGFNQPSEIAEDLQGTNQGITEQPTRPNLFQTVTRPSNIAGAPQSQVQSSTEQPARPSLFQKVTRPTDDFSVTKSPNDQAKETVQTPASTVPKQADRGLSALQYNTKAITHTPPDTRPKPHSWFTDEEKMQTSIGWRLKELDEGYRMYLKQDNSEEFKVLKEFYDERKKMILNAGDGPLKSFTGQKRQSNALDESDASQPKLKRVTVPGSQSSAEASFVNDSKTQHVDSTPTPHNPLSKLKGKRKADEDAVDDQNERGNEMAKRARGPEAPASQTSNLFSSILGSNNASIPSKAQNAVDTTPAANASQSNPFHPQASPTKNAFGSGIGNSSSSSLFSPQSPSTTDINVTPFASHDKTQSSIFSSKTLGSVRSFQDPKSLSTNPFTFAPASAQPADVDALATASSPMTKPPVFPMAATPTFMSQFGNAAKQESEKAREKRKADEYDSEDEDEASWEEKDAEREHQKKQKVEQAAKIAQKFVPDLTTNSATQSKAGPTSTAQSTVPAAPKSIFDMQSPIFTQQSNIFGHLAKPNSESDVEKSIGGSDEDDDESDLAEKQSSSSVQPAAKGLFDRVSIPAAKANASGSDESQVNDHTWKADSPIKFGATAFNTSAPSLKVSSDTLSKPPAAGLFGAPSFNATSDVPATKPNANIFSSFGSPGGAVGFGFAPAKTAVSTLAPPSNDTSRATSPGIATGESATESAAEGTEDSTEKHEQLDLMSNRAGEEDEDVQFEVRAKGVCWDRETSKMIPRGVGPLRILNNGKTGKRRIVLRADPSGRVIINSPIVPEANIQYDRFAVAMRGLFMDGNGEQSPWQIRVKQDADLHKMMDVLGVKKGLKGSEE